MSVSFRDQSRAQEEDKSAKGKGAREKGKAKREEGVNGLLLLVSRLQVTVSDVNVLLRCTATVQGSRGTGFINVSLLSAPSLPFSTLRHRTILCQLSILSRLGFLLQPSPSRPDRPRTET